MNRSSPSSAAWATLPLFFILLFFPAACGKKAPPIPPRAIPPPPVRTLEGDVADGVVHLRWAHPGGDVEWFRLYRHREALDAPACDKCPIRFQRIADIPARSEEMIHAVPIRKGYRYRYKVVPVSGAGLTGDDSNPVEFDY